MDNPAGTAIVFILFQVAVIAWAIYGVSFINERGSWFRQ